MFNRVSIITQTLSGGFWSNPVALIGYSLLKPVGRKMCRKMKEHGRKKRGVVVLITNGIVKREMIITFGHTCTIMPQGKECWFCHTCVLDPISPQSTYYWCECVSQRKYTDVWFAKFEEERKRTRLTSAIVLALLTTSMNPVFGPVAMQPYGMRQRSDSPSSSHSCNTQISSWIIHDHTKISIIYSGTSPDTKMGQMSILEMCPCFSPPSQRERTFVEWSCPVGGRHPVSGSDEWGSASERWDGYCTSPATLVSACFPVKKT